MWDFVFLIDVCNYINQLNMKLQTQNKFIFALLNNVTAFENKLKLFILQVGAGNFIHFSTCSDFLKQTEVPAPTKKYAGYLTNLLAEFHARFSHLRKQETEFRIIENPFCVHENDVPEIYQMELMRIRVHPPAVDGSSVPSLVKRFMTNCCYFTFRTYVSFSL